MGFCFVFAKLGKNSSGIQMEVLHPFPILAALTLWISD